MSAQRSVVVRERENEAEVLIPDERMFRVAVLDRNNLQLKRHQTAVGKQDNNLPVPISTENPGGRGVLLKNLCGGVRHAS